MDCKGASELIDRVVAECDAAVALVDKAESVSEIAQLEGLINGLTCYIYRRREGHLERLRGKDLDRAALFERKAKESLEWLREVHANPNHRQEMEEGLKANNART